MTTMITMMVVTMIVQQCVMVPAELQVVTIMMVMEMFIGGGCGVGDDGIYVDVGNDGRQRSSSPMPMVARAVEP